MTNIHITSIPEKAEELTAVPFRVIVPKQLDVETARALYKALVDNEDIKAQDPFWLQDVSCVFPGTIFVFDEGIADAFVYGLEEVKATIASVVNALADDFGDDVIIELDVPDALTDAVVLDVTDLTQPPTE